MKPLFEVGEEVLLVSEVSSGSYTISEVKYIDGTTLVSHTKKPFYGFAYRFLEDNGKRSWGERLLRKKHKPSEYDFNQLIEEVNNLVTVQDL